MPEYLPITKVKSGSLRRNERLDILFKVVNQGLVHISAYARWDRLFPPDPTRRKIELFRPNQGVPVASQTDEGFWRTSYLMYNVSASEAGSGQNWIARVTNRENSTEYFRLRVRYPSNIEVKTFAVPVSIVNSFVGATIGQIKIRVTDGANASYIRFPSSFGVPEKKFTVARFTYKINMPWPIPDIKISERVSNINSSSVDFSLNNATSVYPNGFMRFIVKFEESGREILGTFPANLSKMKLTLDLGLETRNLKISYNRDSVGVDFYCKVNLVNVPDSLERYVLDPIINYTERIRRAVEDVVRAVFASESLRIAFSNAITAKVSSLLGSNAKIVSVKVQSNQLIVRYYNP